MSSHSFYVLFNSWAGKKYFTPSITYIFIGYILFSKKCFDQNLLSKNADFKNRIVIIKK